MNARPAALFVSTALAVCAFAPARASGILDVFQPKTVKAITVTPGDEKALRALPPLDAFGTVRGTRSPGIAELGSAAEVAANARFRPRVPADVPAEIKNTVRYSVSAPVNSTFTFSAAKTKAWAAREHVALRPMPRTLDGTVVRAMVAPVAIIAYGAGPAHQHRPGVGLTIVEAPVPRITTSGASLHDITAYLLAQPGIPADVAAQIRAIGDPDQTLPIPIRFDKQTATSVAVDGTRGLVIGDQTGIGSAVVWQKNGMFYAVGGTFAQDRILAIADSLR
ncbi:MAG: hypothetical protein ABR591_05520 [Candidatus Velthaea sp.]